MTQTADGTPYWVGRHSGGTIFGEEGFFRIQRGVNALNIESHCGWATILHPDPPRGNSSTLPCENGVPRPFVPDRWACVCVSAPSLGCGSHTPRFRLSRIASSWVTKSSLGKRCVMLLDGTQSTKREFGSHDSHLDYYSSSTRNRPRQDAIIS
jgi:hypothetical protein